MTTATKGKKFKTVAELFSKKERWTKGAEAKDVDGVCVNDVRDVKAAQWCLIGACKNVYGDGTGKYKAAIRHLALALYAAKKCKADKDIDTTVYEDDIVSYNDGGKRDIADIRKIVKAAGV